MDAIRKKMQSMKVKLTLANFRNMQKAFCVLKFNAELRDFCDEVFSSRNSLTVHKIGFHINRYCMLDKTHLAAAALLSVGFIVFFKFVSNCDIKC